MAFESQLTLSAIAERTTQFTGDRRIEPTALLDAVFVLDRGWLINFGDGKGSLQLRTGNGQPVVGWAAKRSDSVLFYLLGWLSVVMPTMIRVKPILRAYIVPGLADSG